MINLASNHLIHFFRKAFHDLGHGPDPILVLVRLRKDDKVFLLYELTMTVEAAAVNIVWYFTTRMMTKTTVVRIVLKKVEILDSFVWKFLKY